MKLHLLTFGSPFENYKWTLYRLEKESKYIKSFETINIFSDKNIFDFCSDLKIHEDFMKNTRGYGYWIWKYFLISELFKKINDDEVILYVDAGCTINENGTKKLKDYYDKVVENGMLAFQMPHLIEKHYTKMDTYKKIIGRDMSHYETGQVHASTFFIKKNQKNMEFIENIKSICVQDNYHYVDDSKSIENNNKSFIENRHDQSIFSLMCKKYKSYLIDDETYWEPNWSLFGKEYPLWVTRIK